eukprot:6181040-Pleurochrysis_carterae.AAC.1
MEVHSSHEPSSNHDSKVRTLPVYPFSCVSAHAAMFDSQAAGIEVPLWVFAGSLTAFRAALGIRAGVKYYFTRRSRINAGIGGTERSLDEGDEAS